MLASNEFIFYFVDKWKKKILNSFLNACLRAFCSTDSIWLNIFNTCPNRHDFAFGQSKGLEFSLQYFAETKNLFADPVLLSSITVGCVLLPEFQNTLIQKTMEQICRQNIFLGAKYCSGFDLLTGTNTGKYLRFLFVRKRDLANKSQCALFTWLKELNKSLLEKKYVGKAKNNFVIE